MSIIGGVTLHNIEIARFLPPIKFISWITIGSSLELDRQSKNYGHKFISGLSTPAAIVD